MKKKNKAVKVLLFILFLIADMGISWGITCGIIKLITMCFGWNFSWRAATGIFLIMILINEMRLNRNRE